MQALALELSPMLTEFSNDVSLDPKLIRPGQGGLTIGGSRWG